MTTYDLSFDEAEHAYTLNGRRVPSVTQILDPLQALEGIPWDVLEAAREFGNHVHMGCHLYNLGTLDWESLDPFLASYIRGYVKFLQETSFLVLASEERVASVQCGYAGTLDLRGILNKRKWIADIKSTAVLPRTVGPQTAAYERAFNETSGESYKLRACLHLKPDDYKFVPLTDKGSRVGDFNLFASALNVHRWRHES